jgi:hypothetical protein
MTSIKIPARLVADAPLLICTPQGVALAPVATVKRCARCGEEKSVAAFNKEKKKKDGMSAWCKACKSKDQSRRRRDVLVFDPSWVERRKTYAKLARLVDKGAIAKPTQCPQCGRAVAVREMQARFKDGREPTSVEWRCRPCALAEIGKSEVSACRWCDEPFVVQTHQLRRGGGRYCSVRCRNAWMKSTAEHTKKTAVRMRAKAEQVYMDDRF